MCVTKVNPEGEQSIRTKPPGNTAAGKQISSPHVGVAEALPQVELNLIFGERCYLVVSQFKRRTWKWNTYAAIFDPPVATVSPKDVAHGPNLRGWRSSRNLLRPVCLLRIEKDAEISLLRSNASFCDITLSQKNTTAFHNLSMPTMVRTKVGRETA